VSLAQTDSASGERDEFDEPDGPQTRLSPLRILIALVLVAALGAGIY
jgi:hypothetical protein